MHHSRHRQSRHHDRQRRPSDDRFGPALRSGSVDDPRACPHPAGRSVARRRHPGVGPACPFPVGPGVAAAVGPAAVGPGTEKAWSELERQGEVLRSTGALESRGAHVYVPRGDQDYAITVGLRMLTLRHLVDDAGGLYRARPAELPLLRYYANAIAHLF